MGKKQSAGVMCFLIITALLSSCFWTYSTAASDSEQSSVTSSFVVDSNSQSELTEELWSLVRSLRQLRSDYYEKQTQRADKIQQLRDVSQKLQVEADELRRSENQLDKSIAQIDSDIEKLQIENKKNKSIELSVAKKLDGFVLEQAEKIEKGIEYRKNDRLMRLKGITSTEQLQQEQSVGDVFGRVWSFSQEELRIARSGEAFTDLVSLDDGRLQHARVFRVGHQILGYMTEKDEQTGIWIEGIGWEKAKNSKAEAVKTAVRILDRRSIPAYVQLPVKIEPVNTKAEVEKD